MAEFETLDWYDAPKYYDIVFDEDTVREADFLEAALEKHGTPPKRRGSLRVLEPACGSGRLVVEFARRGARVAGFDLSQPMLVFAGERLAKEGLEAKLFKASMQEFSVRGSFDLAHCLVSTFKYVDTEAGARSHLQRVAAALRPGGIYALGFHLSDYTSDRLDRERWVAERDGAHVVCNIQGWPPDPTTRTERVRSRMVVQEGGRERRLETNWTFRTYNERQVRRMLRAVPEFEHLATYDFRYRINEPGSLDGDHLDVLLILRRKPVEPSGPAPARNRAKKGTA